MTRARTIYVCLITSLVALSGQLAEAGINGNVVRKDVGPNLQMAIESLARTAGEAPAWVGYEVPITDPSFEMCCGWADGESLRTECELDRGRTYSMGRRDGSPPVWNQGKSLVVLYRFGGDLDEIRLYTSDCNVHADDSTVYWLGAADSGQSVALLADIVEGRWPGARPGAREDALTAVALHDGPSPVIRLERWARGELAGKSRGTAVFWLGNVGGSRGFEVVRDLAWSDDDSEIRDKAVFALSLGRTDESTRELTRIAREHRDPETREKAVFWLGQKKTPEVVALLAELVESDPDEDVKEKAVFALSQVGSEEAIEALIGFARTHPTTEIRKKSLFWLGQIAGRKIADLLEAVVDDPNDDLREYAVFAISQRPREEAVPVLSRLATTHPSLRVRKKALFWLSQIDDDGAVATIESILED